MPEEVVISADPPRSFTKMMVKVQKALNIIYYIRVESRYSVP